MNLQLTPLIIPLFIAAGISMWLSFYAWKHRLATGAIPFALFTLAMAVWSFVYALRLSSVDLATKLFWAKLRYVGIVTVPTAWFIFVLQYTGQKKWLAPKWIVALIVEPLLTLLLVWTNELHGAVWSHTDVLYNGSLVLWNADHGIWHRIHGIYTYSMLSWSTVLLVLAFIRAPNPYRRQTGALLISALVPFVGDVLSTYNLVSIALDLTPFAFTISSLMAAASIFLFRLFDIVPLARNAVVDNTSDAVFVIDVQGHVVDINPSAENLIGRPASQSLGQPIEQVLPQLDLPEHLDDTLVHDVVTLENDAAQRSYDLHISPIYDQHNDPVGRLIILHDITERRQAEAGLRAQTRLFESLVAMARATAKQTSLEDTLQSTLNMAVALTGAEQGSMFLLDGNGVVTHSVLARGETSSALRDNLVGRAMDEGLAGWVVQNRRPALIADTFLDQRWVDLPDAPYETRSVLVTPIVIGSAVLGVLTLQHSEPDFFNPEHTYLIQSSTDQIVLAIRNAQMYDEQRRLADHQTTLYESLRTMGQHLDSETIVQTAAQTVARLTGWPAIAIFLPNDTATRLAIQAGTGMLSTAKGQSISVNQGITGKAYRTAQMEYVPNVGIDPDYVGYNVQVGTIFRSELAVPLQRGERVLGVLDVADSRPSAFTEDDILLARSLAEAIALALDNARLYAEIRQYADAIAGERSRLQALIESSRDGIILIGTNRCILVINAPALDFLHLTGQPGDWINQSIRDLMNVLKRHAPDVVQNILAEMRRVQTGDEPPGEGEWEVPPRTIHWINLPVITGTMPVGRLLVLHDVTEERLLEKMREDLVHTMVHDLRNPLTAIAGVLSFLEEPILDSLSPGQHELWEIAQKSTKGMLNLIKAILEISRLESRQIPLDHSLVSLSELVADVLESQLPLAVDKNLHLASDVPSDLPPAWADRRMIERVLQNLVGNAIKFTPADGEVRVIAKLETTAPSRLLVLVNDTGTGISPEVQERLFQKFTTGEQEERGSGLGLAFCKMVIESHNERIWVEDTSEHGTTFAFTLPLHSAIKP